MKNEKKERKKKKQEKKIGESSYPVIIQIYLCLYVRRMYYKNTPAAMVHFFPREWIDSFNK